MVEYFDKPVEAMKHWLCGHRPNNYPSLKGKHEANTSDLQPSPEHIFNVFTIDFQLDSRIVLFASNSFATGNILAYNWICHYVDDFIVNTFQDFLVILKRTLQNYYKVLKNVSSLLILLLVLLLLLGLIITQH